MQAEDIGGQGTLDYVLSGTDITEPKEGRRRKRQTSLARTDS